MAHIVWYIKHMEEEHLNFIQWPKLSKNKQFGGDADIYMDKTICITVKQNTYIQL